MKLNPIVFALLTAAIVVTVGSGCATSTATLEAQAKVPKAQAQQTALAKVPGGAVEECELEAEADRLVWSFEITTPGTKDLTEVLVDARTGEVVSLEPETSAEQEKKEQEAAEEKTSQNRDEPWQETLSAPSEPFLTAGRNRYFILEPGYQLVLEGKEGSKPVQLTITVLHETKPVAGVETRVVEERETADGQLVEVSRNYLALGAQTHHVCYFGEDVDAYKDGQVEHGGAWLAGVNGAKFGILMPGDVKVGDRYYQEKAPGVAMDRAENVSVTETVTTPAGTFTPCLKVKETTPLEPGAVEYKTYAPDVGLLQDGAMRLLRHGFVKE